MKATQTFRKVGACPAIAVPEAAYAKSNGFAEFSLPKGPVPWRNFRRRGGYLYPLHLDVWANWDGVDATWANVGVGPTNLSVDHEIEGRHVGSLRIRVAYTSHFFSLPGPISMVSFMI